MRALVLAIAMLLAWAAAARAQPWAQGVSEAAKADAQKKLEAGNQLFLAKKYQEALVQYEAATKVWDHPAIRFNMVRCQILLDHLVEASENLQLALKYGKEPLEDSVYTEALGYQQLLAKQIGELDVSCKEPSARVILDGQKLMTCPGREVRRLRIGEHGVVAMKEGFMTKQLTVNIVGDKPQHVELELLPISKSARIVHRWNGWLPWLVFGSGLVVASAGGLLEFSAADIMHDYDGQIARDCMVMACDLRDPAHAELKATYDRANTRQLIAGTVIGVGLAGAAIGGVMLFLNRGQTIYDNSAEVRGARLEVVPRDGGGVMTVSGRF